MRSIMSVAALLLPLASATPRQAPTPVSRLPEAVLDRPATGENPLLRALPWRSSSQAFATWSGSQLVTCTTTVDCSKMGWPGAG